MKQTIKYFIIPVMLMSMILSNACTKTKKDAYKAWEAGGELIYPGRADSVIVRAGYKRIELSIVLGNDPRVKTLRIYWNNQHDSLDASVAHTTGPDTINVIIPNLAEGNYNFTVNTFDTDGNRSVDSYGSGIVYGDSYVSSLANRTLQSVTQSTDGNNILLTWGGASEGDLGTEVNYVGADGLSHKIVVPSTDGATTLPDYEGGSKLTYQTLYKPDATAFEFFSPTAGEVTLPGFERQFNKANFQIVILPTDVLEGGYGWLENYLWDESYDPPGFATQSKVPCWFTIDAGESASISRFKTWQANDRLYDKESVKTFELYGSNGPNPDGSFDASWTQIGGTYESIKPSGLPVGQTTQADIDYALAGEEFAAPANTPKFRYYRFKLLTNFGSSNFFTMEEITFYTHDK